MAEDPTSAELRQFAKDLKAIGPEWPRMLSKVHRTIAKKATEKASARASSMGGIQAKASGALKGSGTQQAATIKVDANGSTRFANVAFWGAKKRTGWYAHINSPNGRPQHPKWVGSSWEPGVAGQGPYAINDAIAEYGEELLDDWRKGLTELTAKAFPD